MINDDALAEFVNEFNSKLGFDVLILKNIDNKTSKENNNTTIKSHQTEKE